jgi:hypothetical protein
MPSEIEQTVERTYRAYFTVFQMGNPRAITPYYHVPAFFQSPEGAHLLANGQDAEQFFERLIYSLRTRGYARSVLTSVQVIQLGEDLALVNTRGERLTREGALVEPISEMYTMRQTEGTWRISTATIYEPDYPLEIA